MHRHFLRGPSGAIGSTTTRTRTRLPTVWNGCVPVLCGTTNLFLCKVELGRVALEYLFIYDSFSTDNPVNLHKTATRALNQYVAVLLYGTR